MFLLKIITVLSLLFSPFGELIRIDLGNNIILKPLDILTGLGTICWVIFIIKNHSKVKYWYVFLFPLFGFISLLFNISWLKPNEFIAAFLYLIRWITYAGMFFIVLLFDNNFKQKISLLLGLDGAIILIAGFIQYFFYNSLINLFYLGWDKHMHRIFSTFFDPNFAGAFFDLFFLFLLGQLVIFVKKKQKKRVITVSLLLIITLIGIFLTFSRASLLMLLTGSATFFILINKKKFVFIILGAILIFALIASPKFNDENMNLLRIASSQARLSNYSSALQIIQKEPLFGVGFDSYRYAKAHYGIQEGWANAPSHADAGVDNSLFFILATTGIVGLSISLILWILLFKNAYHIYKNKKNIMGVVVISSSVGLFVHALFINSLFYSFLMLWMWILLGLCEDTN